MLLTKIKTGTHVLLVATTIALTGSLVALGSNRIGHKSKLKSAKEEEASTRTPPDIKGGVRNYFEDSRNKWNFTILGKCESVTNHDWFRAVGGRGFEDSAPATRSSLLLQGPGAEMVPTKEPVVMPAPMWYKRSTVKLPVAPANRPVPPVMVAVSSM
jgi:hypothetical protein